MRSRAEAPAPRLAFAIRSMPVARLVVPLVLGLLLATARPAAAAFPPPEHPLFLGETVHEIHLTFHQEAWWDSLVINFEEYDEPLYMAAEFDWADVHFDSIGVRFKGFSSYWFYPGDKKSFKLDLDHFAPEQQLAGLNKLNLNNVFKDPSFVREKCFWELVDWLEAPALRVNYAAVYLNGAYWGLYTLLEQVDDTFIEQRLGANENGNLWKGDPEGTLEWLGPDETSYHPHYELKTNQTENDWSALVDLIGALEFTPTPALPDTLSPRLEIGSALTMLALNSLTVNLDSYTGTARNFYLYHQVLDDRFLLLPWDTNMAWGTYRHEMSINDLKVLPPFWVAENRPLAERLWERPEYAQLYRGIIRKLMAGAAEPDLLLARMEALRDLIRPWVYADTLKMYSNNEFEMAMSINFGSEPALEPFIRERHAYLESEIGVWDAETYAGLALNELMADNGHTIADEYNEFDDWIEIANGGDQAIALDGLTLTDDLAFPGAYSLPAVTLPPGEYLLIWADDQPLQGDMHAPFRLDAQGESLYLLASGDLLDQTSYPALGSDLSWGRWPDATGDWRRLSAATPGSANQHEDEPESLALFINEFMASNTLTVQDEVGQYEDWVEIFNGSRLTVDLGGLFLTDDISQTTQWSFPDTSLASGELLVVWCDDDLADGPLHANFKLSAGGETVALFGRVSAGNPLIDSYEFGPQAADVSEGRYYDGGLPWIFFDQPTPGSTNRESVAAPETPPAALELLANHPNPFNPTTRLNFVTPQPGRVRLEIYDARGRRLRLLHDGELPAGIHALDWNGRDEAGQALPSGLYLSRLILDGEADSGRLLLLR